MGIGDLMVMALSGYVFVNTFDLTRIRTLHWTGYSTLFACGVVGILLTLISYPLAVWTTQWFNHIWPASVGTWFRAGFLAILIAWPIALLMNTFMNQFFAQLKPRSIRKLAVRQGNLIEVLLYDAIEQGRIVELSLESGKSYVGRPLSSVYVAHGVTKDIELIAMFSGHRDEHTKKLKLDLYYDTDINRLLALRYSDVGRQVDLSEFKVVIPAERVVSARFFDQEIYLRMNPELVQNVQH